MAIWMEVRCDFRRNGACYSAQNNGPMAMSEAVTHAAVRKCMSDLVAQAVQEGWLLASNRLICPYCRKAAKEPYG